jgi:hypothetical protein
MTQAEIDTAYKHFRQLVLSFASLSDPQRDGLLSAVDLYWKAAKPLPEVDYRKILVKYIENVGLCEGVDFIYKQINGLTPAEVAELARAGADGSDINEEYRQELLKMARELEREG